MNSTCPVTHENLMAYRDGELSRIERWRIARHLQRCPLCRKEIDIMNAITEELCTDETKAEADALKPALRDRILAGAPEPAIPDTLSKGPVDSTKETPRKIPFRFAAVEWGAGIVVCLLVMAFSMTFMGHRVSNTFNQATGSLSDDEDDAYSYRASKPSAPAAAAPMVSIPPSGNMPSSATIAERQANPSMRGQYFAKAARPDASASSNSTGSSTTDDLPSALRKVDKKANITVQVAQVEQSGATVESMVVSAGGFVANNSLITGANGLKTNSISLRVPVAKFESILSQIAQLGNVKSKDVTGEDITEQYSDADQEQRVMGSELSVKEAQLQQALKREADLLKHKNERQRVLFQSQIPWQQRAEVRELRIRTAQARARLQLLQRISALSAIEVELQEKPPVPGQSGLLQEMGSTGRDAFASFLLAVRIPLNLLIWILAYAPLWLPLLLIYRYLSHRYGQQS